MERGSTMTRRAAPPPGQAAMPAPNAAALLRHNATDVSIRDRPAVKFGDRVWTHGEYVEEARRWSQLFLARAPAGRALHVGVLLDNTPDYLFALGGAALAGAAVVGLNHTRRDEHLLRSARAHAPGVDRDRAAPRAVARADRGTPAHRGRQPARLDP